MSGGTVVVDLRRWPSFFLIVATCFFLVVAWSWRHDAPVDVPPLEDAVVLQGKLHFVDGARDWRAAVLEATDGRTVELSCARWRARDACFTPEQGERLDGKPSIAWIAEPAGVLQLDVGQERVIDVADTRQRLSAPRKSEALAVASVAWLIAATVFFILRIRLARNQRRLLHHDNV